LLLLILIFVNFFVSLRNNNKLKFEIFVSGHTKKLFGGVTKTNDGFVAALDIIFEFLEWDPLAIHFIKWV
jgi:hypothetical protein